MLEKPPIKEEEYFAKVEFERRRKIEIDKHKNTEKQEKDRLKKLHYMCCPKCGRKLIEIPYKGLLIDKCSGCHGIWLDPGELDKIVNDNKKTILHKFAEIFKV